MVDPGGETIIGNEELKERNAADLRIGELNHSAIAAHKPSLYLGLLLVAALAVGVYWNSLSNSFVYDDKATIVENTFIRDFKNLSKFLSRDYFSQASELTYRPVITFSYMADFFFWGQNPRGFHAANILLHMVNSLLIFLIAFSIWRCAAAALACGLIFASYPVMSEAVNAISFREDVLSTSFFFAALLIHIAFGPDPVVLKKKLSQILSLVRRGSLIFVCSSDKGDGY